MRSYTVKKIQGAPDWNTIPVMPIDNHQWKEPVDITAQAQICWDDEALYIRQEAKEANIRAEQEGPLAMPCVDSCLEFFFRPAQRLDYINFELNPKCALYLGYGSKGTGLVRLLARDVNKMFAPKAQMTDDGWVLTYQIPFAFIRQFFPEIVPEEGLVFCANTYKCGDATVKPHYMSWNYIDLEKPNFHCPEHFGQLILGGE